MQDRIGYLRQLKAVFLKEKNINQNAYQNLYEICEYLTTLAVNMSQIQFEEECDALQLVAAFIKAQTTAKIDIPAFSKENEDFAKFLQRLSTNSITPASIYNELMDWGCFLQKKYSAYKPFLNDSLLPGFDNRYENRYVLREDIRRENYEWYLNQPKKIKEHMATSKIIYYCSPLFFIVPLSLCFVAMGCFLCRNKGSKTVGEFFGMLLGSFLMSLPIINCISAVCLGCLAKSDLNKAQEKLREEPGKGGLIAVRQENDQDSVEFKQFKSQFKQQHSYSKDYAVQGKSRPKNLRTSSGITYVDAEKARREQFYREKWNESKSSSRQEAKDSTVTDFFNGLNQSKRRSREISNQVLKLHDEAIRSQPTHRRT